MYKRQAVSLSQVALEGAHAFLFYQDSHQDHVAGQGRRIDLVALLKKDLDVGLGPVDAPQVPDAGPVIIAPNHFSFLDHFFVAAFLLITILVALYSQLIRLALIVVLCSLVAVVWTAQGRLNCAGVR